MLSRVFSKTLFKLLVIFLAFKLTVLLAYTVYEHFPLQLIHFEHFAIEDVEFNDIFYAVNEDNSQLEKGVVLINGGSLPVAGFRQSLAELIDKVALYKPSAIGIDYYFETHKDPTADSLLQACFLAHPNLVLATNLLNHRKQVFHASLSGFVNFPEESGMSIRHYYNYAVKGRDTVLSFALQLARFGSGGKVNYDSVTYLKYSCSQSGYYDLLDSVVPLNYPAYEASDIINNPAKINPAFLKNKIVIIGNLGNVSMKNPFDIEDKFRVPTDTTLINRLPIMPGAVIHANAVDQMSRGNRFFEIEGMTNFLLTSLILFLYLFVFYKIHHRYKLGNAINILIILASTIPLIYLSCIVMMGVGIYFKVGHLFMQIAFLDEFIEIANGFRSKFFKADNHEI